MTIWKKIGFPCSLLWIRVMRAYSGSLRNGRERPRGLCGPPAKGEPLPLGFPSFGGGGGDGRLRPSPYLAGTPCLADTSRRDDRPPTHFFVKKIHPHRRRRVCGAGSTPHPGGSFFLYEKSVLRESDCLRGRREEVRTDLTPPLFRP